MAARGRRKEIEDPNNTWDMQLMAATLRSDTPEIQNLIAKGAKIDHVALDAQKRNVTPFLAAALKGDVDTMEWICQSATTPGDPNAQIDGNKGGIFHYCIRNDQADLLEKLASHRLKVSERFSFDVTDGTGQTAVQLAINLLKPDLARVLLRYGANHTFRSLVDSVHCQSARACVMGQVQLLEVLLAIGDNPYQRDINGQTLVHLGMQHPGVLDLLVDRGVSMNILNANDQTPLIYCVQNMPKALDVVEHLLTRQADINEGDGIMKATPLMFAIAGYHTEMIRKLVESKCDINARDKFGASAMHWAVVARHKGALELLLNLEADVNATDFQGETSLHRACIQGKTESVTTLLGREALDINLADKNGNSALHVTVMAKQVRCVEALLKRVSDENPFLPVVAEKGKEGKKAPAPKKGAVVQEAVSAKLNIDAVNNDNQAAIQLAIHANHTHIAEMLIQAGCNIHQITDRGNLLHEAVFQGNLTLVQALANGGSQIDARNKDDLSPLHLAAQQGFVDIAAVLVKAGAVVNPQDCIHLRTPLHIAAVRRDVEMMALLLKTGKASTILTDEHLQTPLHIACLMKSTEAVSLLLEYGAPPRTCVDQNGWTPFHCACSVDLKAALFLLTAPTAPAVQKTAPHCENCAAKEEQAALSDDPQSVMEKTGGTQKTGDFDKTGASQSALEKTSGTQKDAFDKTATSIRSAAASHQANMEKTGGTVTSEKSGAGGQLSTAGEVQQGEAELKEEEAPQEQDQDENAAVTTSIVEPTLESELERFSNLTWRTNDLQSPLHICVANGAIHCLETVLEMLQALQQLLESYGSGYERVMTDLHGPYGGGVKTSGSSRAGSAPLSDGSLVLQQLSLADQLERYPLLMAGEYGFKDIGKMLVQWKQNEQKRRSGANVLNTRSA